MAMMGDFGGIVSRNHVVQEPLCRRHGHNVCACRFLYRGGVMTDGKCAPVSALGNSVIYGLQLTLRD